MDWDEYCWDDRGWYEGLPKGVVYGIAARADASFEKTETEKTGNPNIFPYIRRKKWFRKFAESLKKKVGNLMAKKDTGKLLSNGRFMTPKFRINYPCLCTRRPETEKYDPGRFTVQAVFFPEEADLTLMKAQIDACAKAAGHKKRFKSPIVDDEDYGDDVERANLKYYAKRGRPVVVWADKTPVETDEEIIPGSYARAIVTFYAYDKEGQGVLCSLESIQCLGGGTRFVGGGAAAAAKAADEEFESCEMEDTAEPDEEDDDDL